MYIVVIMNIPFPRVIRLVCLLVNQNMQARSNKGLWNHPKPYSYYGSNILNTQLMLNLVGNALYPVLQVMPNLK